MRARSWVVILGCASLGACDRPIDFVGNAFSAVDSTLGDTPNWVPGQPPPNNLVPSNGAYVGLEINGPFSATTALCNAMPYRLALLNELWGATPTPYAASDLSELIASGVFPVVSWGPDPEGSDGTLNAIINGSQDAVITTMAQMAASVDGPFFLRFGNEPNGDWLPQNQWSWQGFYNGGCTTATANASCVTTCNGPAQYVQAYQHVHDLFVAAGALNVVWVWSLNVGNAPNCPWNTWDKYYPGDTYVDWIGAVSYNWGNATTGSQWLEFTSLFGDFVSNYAPSGKPIMITETATASGGDRGQWIINMHDALESPAYASVKGLIYVDITQSGVDWELTSNNGDDSLADFCASFTNPSDPFFNPPIP